jgi:peptide chain release factor subunit 1
LDTGRFCFGVEDTLKALELGAVETLIVWENLETNRYVFKNPTSEETSVVHLSKEQEKDRAHFVDPVSNVDLEVEAKESLLEWV